MLCQFLLYSKVNQLYIYQLFSRFYSYIGHYRVLSRVPCAIQQVLISYLFFLIVLFIMFIFGCVGSSFLCEGPLQLQRVGATLHRGARAPHYRGLSCCGAEAPDAQAQQLWLTGPAAPRHVGSSQTSARTRVPCIGRQTPNHCATREAQLSILYIVVCICQSQSPKLSPPPPFPAWYP